MIEQDDLGMPAKLPRITVYVAEELKADLEKLAEAESRSLSNLVGVLLQRAVEEAKKQGQIK